MRYRTGIRALLFGVLALVWACSAQANSHVLPVDSAFSPSARQVDAHHVAVTWQIADGYYLYRHAFSFSFSGADAPTAGKPTIPDGNRHTDEFFGPVETYRHSVRALVPIAGSASLPEGARITVTYQGCADAGLCYPPQTRTLTIAPAATGATSSVASDAVSSAAASPQDMLAHRLAGTDTLSTLLLFFGLGILLTFTPCILPMIPILSALVVGSGARPARAFGLSSAYVLAMALAYTVFGVIAGYFGANIQAALQMPAILLPFAGLFVVLALASFGLVPVHMPGAWRHHLGHIGTRRGGMIGAALMGFSSALIAGPCLAPPLVGALLYISSSGDTLLGGAALFMLGLGMGIPLILIATFGAGLLPRTGPWMHQVRIFFGVVLLGVALWLAARLADPVVALAGWGLLALGYGAYLSTRNAASAPVRACQRAAVFLLWIYAGCALVGVGTGQGRPARPLAGLAGPGTDMAGQADTATAFTRVHTLDQLNAALAAAARRQQPAVVDFYADWCVDCVRMQHTVFAKPAVRSALSDIAAIQVDVTAYNNASRKLMHRFGVFGPPAMLFYRADGQEARDHRLVGLVDAKGFIRQLKLAINGEGNAS